MGKTGLVYSPKYQEHLTDTVESPERLQTIVTTLAQLGLLEQLKLLEPQPAPVEAVAACHDPRYIERLQQLCLGGGGQWTEETVVSSQSYDIALLGAGGVLKATEAVLRGECTNAFALVRPPGHHASYQRGPGFCLFNNIAIAIRQVQKLWQVGKVMVVDWDAHHGNGIQEAFYEDPQVLYCSIHQDGLYPRTGWANEVGKGAGLGYTVNIPVPKLTGDAGYYYIFERLLLPIAQQYQPELLIIAAGYDAHFYDPLSDIEVTTPGFARMTQALLQVAQTCCQGRFVAALEGGYNLGTLGYAVAATLNEMTGAGLTITDPIEPPPNLVRPQVRLRIDDAIAIQKSYWRV